jgi:hypothetical protein
MQFQPGAEKSQLRSTLSVNTLFYAMKTWKRRGKSSRIVENEADIKLHSPSVRLYHWRNSTLCLLVAMVGGPHSRSGRGGEEKNCVTAGIRTPIVQSVVSNFIEGAIFTKSRNFSCLSDCMAQ